MLHPPIRLLALGAVLLVLAAPRPAAAGDEGTEPGTTRYTREVNAEDHVALEVAIREMVPESEQGPRVWLIGVIHIGDEAYYRAVQSTLDLYPAVLYESVMPAGAGRLRDDAPDVRVADTESRLGLLARWTQRLRERGDDLPVDYRGLVTAMRGVAPRLGHLVARVRLDAWGRPIRYEVEDGAFKFASLGADGAPGGEGEARDLVADEASIAANEESLRREPFDLQGRLAAALGLVHQSDGVDYGRKGWQPSDMAIDEVRRAVAARGGDFSKAEDMLAGRGLTGVMVRLFLGLLSAMDAFTNGDARLAVKATLVNKLGSGPAEPEPDGVLDEATIGAIIADRNQVVMEDLDLLCAACPELPSIAIFYGAGHMPDFERRLAERGFRPGRMRWLRAVDVDLSGAGPFTRSLRRRLQQQTEVATGDR